METLNVVVLYVGNYPKGIWKEMELVSYTGRVWWDYMKPITISNQDWVSMDVNSITRKYVK